MWTFAEASWNLGHRNESSFLIWETVNRIYSRNDRRDLFSSGTNGSSCAPAPPDPYNFRIYGTANEYWPVLDYPGGCEIYGWGAALPFHIIRYIFGFREILSSIFFQKDNSSSDFILSPAIPSGLITPQSTKFFQLQNLQFKQLRFDLKYSVPSTNPQIIQILVQFSGSSKIKQVIVKDENGNQIGQGNQTTTFQANNFRIYYLTCYSSTFYKFL